VAAVNELLHQAGRTDPKRPLSKRVEKIAAEPLDPAADEETAALRARLAQAIAELEASLAADFRPPGARP
jgi:hypothetical protein